MESPAPLPRALLGAAAGGALGAAAWGLLAAYAGAAARIASVREPPRIVRVRSN